MARILVEQTFNPPMDEETYNKLAAKLDPCLEVRDSLWRRSYVSGDRGRVICEFEAPDADSVREAMRSAGVPFDRVFAAEVFAIEDYPEMLAKLKELQDRMAGRSK